MTTAGTIFPVLNGVAGIIASLLNAKGQCVHGQECSEARLIRACKDNDDLDTFLDGDMFQLCIITINIRFVEFYKGLNCRIIKF